MKVQKKAAVIFVAYVVGLVSLAPAHAGSGCGQFGCLTSRPPISGTGIIPDDFKAVTPIAVIQPVVTAPVIKVLAPSH